MGDADATPQHADTGSVLIGLPATPYDTLPTPTVTLTSPAPGPRHAVPRVPRRRRVAAIVAAAVAVVATVTAAGWWQAHAGADPLTAIPASAVGYLAITTPDWLQTLNWAQLADQYDALPPTPGSETGTVADWLAPLADVPALPATDETVNSAAVFAMPTTPHTRILAASSNNPVELAADWRGSDTDALDSTAPLYVTTVGDWVYVCATDCLTPTINEVIDGATLADNTQVAADLERVNATGAAVQAWMSSTHLGPEAPVEVQRAAVAVHADGSTIRATMFAADVPGWVGGNGSPLTAVPATATAAAAVTDTTPTLDALLSQFSRAVVDTTAIPATGTSMSQWLTAFTGTAAIYTTGDVTTLPTQDATDPQWGMDVSQSRTPAAAAAAAEELLPHRVITATGSGWRTSDTAATGSLLADPAAAAVLPNATNAAAAVYLNLSTVPDVPFTHAGLTVHRDGPDATATLTLALGDLT